MIQLFIYIYSFFFFFGCAGSLLLHAAFLWLQCLGFSLLWLPLLWSTDSRVWLGNCGGRSLLSHGMWNPPRSGIKPMSSSLAGGFLPLTHQGSPTYSFSYSFPLWFNHRILNKIPWAIQWDLVVYPQDFFAGLFSPRIKQVTGLKRKSNDFLSVVL